MTEDQWWRCNDWRPMCDFLAGRMTQRKVQLYVCAGLRIIWDTLYDEGSKRAVEVSERAADGLATDEELHYASWCAECPTFGHGFHVDKIRRKLAEGKHVDEINHFIKQGVYTLEEIYQETPDDQYGCIGDNKVGNRLHNAAHIAYHNLDSLHSIGRLNSNQLDHLSGQDNWPGGWLMREMFGNPFHPITVKPEWLKWSGGTVPALAQMIYDERAYDRMPILADALQDAGCDNIAMITHCRKGGRHVRGCWVIDALLGKLRFNPPAPATREAR